MCCVEGAQKTRAPAIRTASFVVYRRPVDWDSGYDRTVSCMLNGIVLVFSLAFCPNTVKKGGLTVYRKFRLCVHVPVLVYLSMYV